MKSTALFSIHNDFDVFVLLSKNAVISTDMYRNLGTQINFLIQGTYFGMNFHSKNFTNEEFIICSIIIVHAFSKPRLWPYALL